MLPYLATTLLSAGRASFRSLRVHVRNTRSSNGEWLRAASYDSVPRLCCSAEAPLPRCGWRELEVALSPGLHLQMCPRLFHGRGLMFLC